MKYLPIGLAALIALPALAQGNNAAPAGHAALPAAPPNPAAEAPSTPPPGWLGAGAPVPQELAQYQSRATARCAAFGPVATYVGTITPCDCAAQAITTQAWYDYDNAYSGPFMTPADAEKITEALDAASDVADTSDTLADIHADLSGTARSILASCFTK